MKGYPMRTSLIFAAAVLGSFSGVMMLKAADPAAHAHGEEAPAKEAVCVVMPTEGHKASGVVTFMQTDKGVHITGEIKGLKPGEHGFHIHQFGDVRSADGSSAGGHYNPHGDKHGGPQSAAHHEGDLGNIKADGEGVAKIDVLTDDLHLHFIIGRSIVVHADKDDLATDPAGNSGKRIGVGVIGVAAPPKK
jgi:superoxide dismutase, Cu-Zn family